MQEQREEDENKAKKHYKFTKLKREGMAKEFVKSGLRGPLASS